MKYKPEDIKPKSYPQIEPSKSGHYWIIANGGYVEIFGWVNTIDMWSWDKHVSWFIDIPGAPPELKPLAYPANTPERIGYYWVYTPINDSWTMVFWGGIKGFNQSVTYFIPVRLDRKDDEMDVIWETDELIAEKAPDNTRVILWHPKLELDKVGIFKDELTAFCRHWLDLQGYDVTKREPEIKACPFCGSPVSFIPSERTSYHQLECMSCEYRSPSASTLPEAIRLHNLIARKGE